MSERLNEILRRAEYCYVHGMPDDAFNALVEAIRWLFNARYNSQEWEIHRLRELAAARLGVQTSHLSDERLLEELRIALNNIGNVH